MSVSYMYAVYLSHVRYITRYLKRIVRFCSARMSYNLLLCLMYCTFYALSCDVALPVHIYSFVAPNAYMYLLRPYGDKLVNGIGKIR